MYVHAIGYLSFEGQEAFLHSTSLAFSDCDQTLVKHLHLIPSWSDREEMSPSAINRKQYHMHMYMYYVYTLRRKSLADR